MSWCSYISHEAIYQALYVQGRGALRRELTACRRTSRALRALRARSRGWGKSFITPEILISERPAAAEDRAVPGHWEGDLILGLRRSAIGTLVERTTRFTMLLHLPLMEGHGAAPRETNGPALAGHGAEAVRDAITRTIITLPEQLRRSLTWDQGAEMVEHARLRIDAGLQVYFCDPHSPGQRGTNENTNGLLRPYFPKGTDLSAHGRTTWRRWPRPLTADRARRWAGGRRPRPSTPCCNPFRLALRRSVETRLAALIRVEDLGPTEARERLIECVEAKRHAHRVRQAPREYRPADPVNDGHEVEKAACHQPQGRAEVSHDQVWAEVASVKRV